MGGGKLDPLSLASQGLDSLADDKDATTYTAKEIGADAVGVAMGAGRILTGDVIGGGKQLIGEAVDIGKSIFGRKKARKEQRAAESAAKRDFFATEGEAAEQRVAEQVMGGQMQRAEDASGSLQAMMDKYSEVSAKQRGTLAEKGARLYYKAGGEPRKGSRPVDLRKAKYQEGGQVPMVGGVPIYSANDPVINKAMSELQTQQQKKKAEELMSGIKNNPLRSGNELGFVQDAFDYGGDATFASGLGVYTAGGAAKKKLATQMMLYGTAISSVPELSKMASEELIKTVEKGKEKLKGTKFGDFLGIDENRVAADFEDYEGTTKLKENVSQLAELVPAGKLAKLQKVFKITKKGDKYSDKVVKSSMKTGGMTQGEFSHKTNPLTVVDKKGNDTGMELTGGEGVFDAGAMKKLDRYKKNKNFEEAGKLVFSEMESWKAAGTAKYGTRIKRK